VTIPGQVVGTPAYMSPEQLNGNPVDGRSDLFSLGVIAYWLITGEKPFNGDTLTSISMQIITKDPAPATAIDASLNPEFDYVLGKALAKDPGQRYQRCRDFSLDLQDASAGRQPRSKAAIAEQTIAIKITPAPQTTAVPPPSSEKKIRRLVILYSALGVVLIAGLALLAFNSKPNIISPPANLQIIGQDPFQQAEIAVWVDGDLRYRGQVTGTMHKHGKGNKTTYALEGTINLTIPLPAGKHRIRVHMTAPGASYNEGGSIEGQFNPYAAKTLRADFSNQGLDLNWDRP
jgi:serine/threonine protein kinase